MFSKRRKSRFIAEISDASSSDLAEHIYAALASVLGPHGDWVVSRKTTIDRDDIFQEMFTRSLSRSVARGIAVTDASSAPATESIARPIAFPSHRTTVREAEPAVSWAPSPVSGWAKVELGQNTRDVVSHVA